MSFVYVSNIIYVLSLLLRASSPVFWAFATKDDFLSQKFIDFFFNLFCHTQSSQTLAVGGTVYIVNAELQLRELLIQWNFFLHLTKKKIDSRRKKNWLLLNGCKMLLALSRALHTHTMKTKEREKSRENKSLEKVEQEKRGGEARDNALRNLHSFIKARRLRVTFLYTLFLLNSINLLGARIVVER